MMCAGTDCLAEIPADRWNIKTFFDPKPGTPGKSITKWGAFVEDIDKFDPAFFGISPREADWMDPQQRLLLEACTRALEDGGQDLNALRGSPTGVFVGISTTDYTMLQNGAMEQVKADVYTATGSTISIAANRISYVFDFRGPSVAMDTACSSALTALHFACQSLWRGDCKMALCAGVNALLSPAPYITFSRMGMLSPTGRCQAFDSRANGFVRGEGSGAVLLKPLSQALADGDEIYSVIRATGANQDGRTNGITVPSPVAQETLVRETCLAAGLKPARIDYVEAHGTGTPVGDPIEAHALGQALGEGRPANRPLLIGSVKTNIGHLEAAAGIAGLIKLALVLKHRVIPANLHFRKPNQHVDFKKLKLRVVAKTEKLSATGELYGGINSFGFGGANAHAILQSPPAKKKTTLPRPPKTPGDSTPLVLNLSARSAETLTVVAKNFRAFLKKSPAPLREIARAAVQRRTAHPHRLAVIGHTRAEWVKQLAAFAAGDSAPGLVTGHAEGDAVNPVFVCSGQGPQWWGMGRELLKSNAVFRAKMEECDQLLREFGNWSLLKELARDEKSSRLDNTAIAQPAIFAHQVSLAAVWASLGVKPVAVVGHSVGEVAAAHIAGVLTLREAARVIFQRGRCMSHAQDNGKMLAVGTSPAEAETLAAKFPGRVHVGAYNGPASLTLSGDADALAEISADLEKRGVFNRFLQVKYAFHSHHMDAIRAELARSLGKVKVSKAQLPLYSTVTGKRTNGLDFGANYWWRNVREQVVFATATDNLIQAGHKHFLELSAHPALTGSINECLKRRNVTGFSVASQRRQEPQVNQLFAALAGLHCAGAQVAWQKLFPTTGAKVSLPLYPFQRERHWEEPRTTQHGRIGAAPHPLISRPFPAATPTWLSWLDQDVIRWLPEHRVGGHIVFPGAGYIETALTVGRQQFGDVPLRLEDFAFEKALFLPENKDLIQFQTIYNPSDLRLTFSSRSDHANDEWSLNAKARLAPAPYDAPPANVKVAPIKKRCNQHIIPGEFIYQNQNPKALMFGPHFHGVQKLWRRDHEAVARLRVPKALRRDFANYFFHPAFLDATFHVQTWSLKHMGPKARVYLPVSIDRLRVFGKPGREIWCHVQCVKQEMLALVFNFQIFDGQGNVLVDCEGFRSQATGAAPVASPDSGDDWLYELKWKRRPLAGVPAPADAAKFFPAKITLSTPSETAVAKAAAQKLRAGLDTFAAKPDEKLWRKLLAQFPAAHPELAALRRAAQKQPLTQNLREQLEQDSLSRAALNRAVADAVAGFVADVPADRTVRVLETNGGTGGLAAYVLPRLAAERTSYTFADAEKSALAAAEKKFFEHNFVRYERLDLAQKFSGKGQHDLVLTQAAAPSTAANLRRLLAPGGQLLVLAQTAPPAWSKKLSNAPATSRRAWLAALKSAGFEAISALEFSAAQNLAGYELLAARAPQAVAAPVALPKAVKPVTWLLFADQTGFAEKFAAQLQARGDATRLLAPGATKAAFAQILAEAKRKAKSPIGGIVFLRPLDFAAPQVDAELLQRAEKEICHAALHLMQALTERGMTGVPPVWFVTRGAAPVLPGEILSPAATALTGLARTIASEYMKVRTCLVDLTPGGDDAFALAQEVTASGDTETEIAYRGATRFANRLVRATLETQPPAVQIPAAKAAHRLEITTPGVIDQLTFHRVERRTPQVGEVEIEIRAAALNFRDVMKALGIYPSENEFDLLIGDECSGV
ncbi:MAG: hypothetical protein RL380_252, partial [Verrucomicrobiota bacterium]